MLPHPGTPRFLILILSESRHRPPTHSLSHPPSPSSLSLYIPPPLPYKPSPTSFSHSILFLLLMLPLATPKRNELKFACGTFNFANRSETFNSPNSPLSLLSLSLSPFEIQRNLSHSTRHLSLP